MEVLASFYFFVKEKNNNQIYVYLVVWLFTRSSSKNSIQIQCVQEYLELRLKYEMRNRLYHKVEKKGMIHVKAPFMLTKIILKFNS